MARPMVSRQLCGGGWPAGTGAQRACVRCKRSAAMGERGTCGHVYGLTLEWCARTHLYLAWVGVPLR